MQRVDWALWGWFGYLTGSVGFLCADTLSVSVRVPDAIYLLLALWFFLDALAYLMAWVAFPVPPKTRTLDAWFWTEAINVFASALSAAAAGMFFFPVQESEGMLAAQTYVLLQSAFYFCSTTLFLCNAVMSASLYYNARVEAQTMSLPEEFHQDKTSYRYRLIPVWRDVSFWAEVFNVIPGVGYWATSVLQLVSSLEIARTADTASMLYRASFAVLTLVRSVNLGFDVMYVLDAILYAVVWVQADKEQGYLEEEEGGLLRDVPMI